MFVVFAIKIIKGDESKWVDIREVDVNFPETRIFNIEDFPTYDVEIDFNYPELAQNCHVSMSGMKRAVSRAPLTIFAWRAFQILPFWGGKPAWLRPLLHPRWKVFFQKEFRGRMLDERVSNIFFLRPFAYRHFIFCQKEQD